MKLLNSPVLLRLKGISFFPRIEHYLAIYFDFSNTLIFNINIAWPKHSFHISKKEVSLLISTVFRGYLFIFSGQERVGSGFSLYF